MSSQSSMRGNIQANAGKSSVPLQLKIWSFDFQQKKKIQAPKLATWLMFYILILLTFLSFSSHVTKLNICYHDDWLMVSCNIGEGSNKKDLVLCKKIHEMTCMRYFTGGVCTCIWMYMVQLYASSLVFDVENNTKIERYVWSIWMCICM